jgi:hypothetical protein
VVARDRGGNSEGRCDSGTQKDRSRTCEGELSDADRERSNDNADRQSAKDAGAILKGAMPAVSPTKNGSAYRVSVKISQQMRPIPEKVRMSPRASMAVAP